jgi:hypothetical protein
MVSCMVSSLGGDNIYGGECEMNERREWCHEVDTHGVSELITHS